MIERIHECQHERTGVDGHGKPHHQHKGDQLFPAGKFIGDEADANSQHLPDAAEHQHEGGHDAKKHNGQ